MRNFWSKLAALATLALPLTVAGCQTATPTTATTNAVCSAWQPITYSASKDTPETVRQVVGNNAAREAFCG